jgi:hypothetical protein
MTSSLPWRAPLRGLRGFIVSSLPVLAPLLLGTVTVAVLGAWPGRLQPVCGSSGLVPQDSAALIRELRPELSPAQAQAWTDRAGPRVCVPRELPRSLAARRLESEEQLDPRAGTPTRAYREAVERKTALMTVQPKVAAANGDWEAYGKGPLIINDPRYAVKYLGLVKTSGRVDSFDYDPVGKRLFATIGTGGVWASTDLGVTWTSLGDGLPSQAVGAVAWSAANGGTLIVGSGEPLFGGGGSVFTGLGAFWTTDLGATWHQSTGIPDGAMTFEVAVDKSNPAIVYVATTKGLYRSANAGQSFTNVALPTSAECAGNNAGKCEQANVVTDVVIRQPGGAPATTCPAQGCPVLAVVGHIGSNLLQYRDGAANALGSPAAPGNGLYRSGTGEPGTFTYLTDPTWVGLSNIGFPPRERIGRTELAVASGPDQDHQYVYAIVQDAVLLTGGLPVLDVPLQRGTQGVPSPTYLNGLYVSPDFGTSWLRLADTAEIAENPNTGSYFATSNAPLRAGFQSWYDEWIEPDPTRTASGVPARLAFGLEEVWANKVTQVPVPQNGTAQSGTDDYGVIGVYFAGESCVVTPLPACTGRGVGVYTTTHPDQHEGIFVPRDDGGVCLFAGNDGGVYRQCVGPGEDFTNQKWGDGHNEGFNTLLAYNIATSKDGTVWFGLQDNGSGKLEGDTRKYIQTYGGDGFFAATDPDNSLVGYSEYVNADMRVTVDGGKSWTDITPPVTAPQFSNPYLMDPTDPLHLITAGPEVVETVDGPETLAALTDNNGGWLDPGSWVEVFNLGTVPDDDTVAKTMTAVGLHGAAAYVGACGRCDGFFARGDRPFKTWLATNVGGDKPPQKAKPDGWHFATAAGLPDRYITAIAIDPADPKIVYVTLGGYGGPHYTPPGRYLDANANIGTGNVFKSVDAGETFTDIAGSVPALRLPSLQASAILLHEGRLLVGTDIGAFISNDTQGTLWAPLGNGLPAVPVMTLQVHPGNPDLLMAGTYGRGVWCYSFSGDPLACDPPPLPPVFAAPVQLEPGAVETPAAYPSCGTDTNGAFAVNFTYTTPAGTFDPTGFQVQEGTEFGDAFLDDAEEPLDGGSNSKWVGTGAWTSAPYSNGSLAYYAPSTMDQSDTLTMAEGVTLLSGGGTLTFDTTQSTEACCDFTFVEISTDGVNFTELASWSGDTLPSTRTVDLSAYSNETVKLRFRIAADALQGGPGWYIDNIRIETNDFVTVGNEPFGSTTHAFSGQTNGKRYYRIGATYDERGTSAAGPFSNYKCVTVELPNVAPTVTVGDGYAIDEGASGMLSGTASDPEGGVLTYAWSQVSPATPTAVIDDPDAATTSFTAPAVNVDTPVTFRLTVTDPKGASATADIEVLVRQVNVPPVADAGVDFAVDEGAGAMLSGAGSSDADGDTLTYAWTQTAGPAVTLTGAGTATASFTAPDVGADTPLTFSLSVSDPSGATATDVVIVTVRALSTPVLIGDNSAGGLPLLTVLMLGLLAGWRRRWPRRSGSASARVFARRPQQQ